MRCLLRVLLLTAPLMAGCSPPVCTAPQPILGADGGVYPCARAEDCPRPGNLLICTSSDDRLRDCVDCIQTQCQRFTRVECSK